MFLAVAAQMFPGTKDDFTKFYIFGTRTSFLYLYEPCSNIQMNIKFNDFEMICGYNKRFFMYAVFYTVHSDFIRTETL